MKKLYLSIFALFLLFLILITSSFPKVYAQDKDPINCEQLRKILGSGECPYYVIESGDVWCAQTAEELTGGLDANGTIIKLYKNRQSDYMIDRSSDYFSEDIEVGKKCLEGVDQQENNAQPEQIQSDQTQPKQDGQKKNQQNNSSRPGPSLLSIGYKWIEGLYLTKFAELIKKVEVIGIEAQKSSEFRERELLERRARLTEETVGQLKQNSQASPYSLDILSGQAQIKYPGESEWKDLKQGDKIPPGSTIFTGMDTTTVLTIAGKGVVQVQSFTEIMINEKGLEDAAKTGQAYTDIELIKGEIEINVDPYIPMIPSGASESQGWGMSIYGPFYSAAVRGTHFWVKQEEGKQFAAIGVYKGSVEVKVRGSDRSTVVSPVGDKPGVVVVTQKFSPLKITLAGAVLVIVVVGIIFFIKRRGNKTLRSKKVR